MTWHVAPEDQGQMVERAYAAGTAYAYRRHRDRSDGTVSYERAAWSGRLADEWEPWNRAPAIREWEPCGEPAEPDRLPARPVLRAH